MNELCAVDPRCADSVNEVKLLLDKFGFSRGRFIEAIPYDWFGAIGEVFVGCPEMDRKRLVAVLERAKARGAVLSMLPPSAMAVSERNWLEAVRQCSRRYQVVLRPIIAKQRLGDEVLALEDVLYDVEQDLPAAHDAHIPRTVDAIASAARPLLRSASQLTLVDPFFRVEADGGRSGHLTVLLALFRESLSVRGACSYRIVCRPSEPMQSETAANIVRHARNEGIHGIQVTLDFRAGLEGKRLHDRYLYSAKGGIGLEAGFAPNRDQEAKMKVAWMSEKTLDEISRYYHPRSGSR